MPEICTAFILIVSTQGKLFSFFRLDTKASVGLHLSQRALSKASLSLYLSLSLMRAHVLARMHEGALARARVSAETKVSRSCDNQQSS